MGSYLFIYSALVFSILWRGSEPPWRTVVLQTMIFTSFFFYGIGRLYSGKSLVDRMGIHLPLIGLTTLLILTSLSAWNKGLALNAWLQFLSLLAGFVVFLDMAKYRKEQVRLLYAVGLLSTGLCIYGLLIHFKIFLFPSWELIAAYQRGNLCATFINHCHMAGWLEMAILFCLPLFFLRDRTITKITLLILMACILLTSLVLTLARGGWIAVSVGLLFVGCAAFSHKSFAFGKKHLTVAGCGTLILLAVILGSTPVTKRGLTVIEQESSSLAGREIGWAGTIDMIKDHPLLGVGPSNYATAFTRYQPPGVSSRFYHAHNDYLQFTAELGVLFIPVLVWLVIVFFKTGFKKLKHPSRQSRWITMSAMGGVVAILAHSAGDFNLQIPSNALLFTLLAAQVTAPAPALKTRFE